MTADKGADHRADRRGGLSSSGHRRRRLGRRGEELAVAFLEGRGCRVLARNYRCRLGEVDLVARDGETLVFVEVKTRRSLAFGGPGEAVGAAKKARLVRVARHYLYRHGLTNVPCRFDVVAVTAAGEELRAEWIRDAFRP